MPHCLNPDGSNNCFWADYNQATGKHDKVEEPDFLGMKNPKAAPKMVRRMQGCGIYRNEWKFGAYQLNNCTQHEDFKDRNERSEKLKKAILEAKKKTYSGKTERKKIPDQSDMFYFLTVMVEDSKIAYEWLMDIYATYGDIDPAKVLGLFSRLNDMNIRGRQIDVIISQWFPKYPDCGVFKDRADVLFEALESNPGSVVECVNLIFDKSDTELAVTEGASLFGHLD